MYDPISLHLRRAAPHLLAGTTLIVLVAAAYANTLHAPFVFDDIPQIRENQAIRINSLSPNQLWTAFSQGPVKGRPLAYLSFALNYYWGGNSLVGYHLGNIAIHVLAGFAAYALALLTINIWRESNAQSPKWLNSQNAQRIAFVAAAIFVLHPIQIQSVTYLVQRMNSLASLFYLTAMVLYIAGRISFRPKIQGTYWTLALITWALALMCKQNTITLPFAIILFELYFLHGFKMQWLPKGWKAWTILAAGLIFVALIVAAISIAQLTLIGDVFNKYQERNFTMAERLLTQPRVLTIYASLAIFPWPTRFNLLHYIDTSHGLLDPPQTLLAIVILAAYTYFALWMATRNRLISYCLLWPLVHLAVESSVLPLEMIYEHRMYLPMFGISLLAAYLLYAVFSGRLAILRAPLIAAILLALAVATHYRNQVWTDPITLWTDVIQKNPYSPRARVNRGGLYAVRGEWANALRDYNSAIAIDETFDDAWFGRATVFANTGDQKRAINSLSAAIALARLNQNRVRAYKNRGAAWTAMGYSHRAIADYSKAIELDPENVGNLYNRANAYYSLGDYSKAIADYRRCIEINPNYEAAHNNLALLLANAPDPALRNPKDALRHALAANEIAGWKKWQLFDTLATAYAANRDFEAAIQWQTRAIEMAPAKAQSQMHEKLSQYRKAADSLP